MVFKSRGSATVNFRLNFRALSKCVKFHPCAVAQGWKQRGTLLYMLDFLNTEICSAIDNRAPDSV